MQMISSRAGRRLAKAVAEYDEKRLGPGAEDRTIELIEVALEAGRELVADGFHLMEGED